MTLTFVGALALTALGGLATETMLDKSAAALTLDERVALELDAMLDRLGWEAPESEALARLAAPLEATHGTRLLVATRPFRLPLPTGLLEGGSPERRLPTSIYVVVAELSRYPEGFLEAAGLERVVLCAGLREAGEPIPSLPNYQGSLLIDVDAPAPFLRRLLHHEVFHFVDFADDHVVKSDPEWSALNVSGFSYGEGGRSVRDPAASLLTEALPGFLTRYATAAVEEDKAEVFAFMMTAPETVLGRARSDGVLGEKVALLERRLEGSFAGRSQDLWRSRGPR